MSEQETTSVAKPEPFVVERSGRPEAKLTIVAQDYQRGAKKEAGEFYLAPEVTAESVDSILDYLGKDFIVAMVRQKMNILCQRYMEEASTGNDEKPKPFDKEEFIKYVSEMSARGLTSDQIDEEIKRLSMSMVAKLPTFTDQTAAMAFAMETGEKIRQLTLDKASRKRKRQEPESPE